MNTVKRQISSSVEWKFTLGSFLQLLVLVFDSVKSNEPMPSYLLCHLECCLTMLHHCPVKMLLEGLSYTDGSCLITLGNPLLTKPFTQCKCAPSKQRKEGQLNHLCVSLRLLGLLNYVWPQKQSLCEKRRKSNEMQLIISVWQKSDTRTSKWGEKKCPSEYWSFIRVLLGLRETMTARDPALHCCDVTVSWEMPGKCPGKEVAPKTYFHTLVRTDMQPKIASPHQKFLSSLP